MTALNVPVALIARYSAPISLDLDGVNGVLADHDDVVLERSTSFIGDFDVVKEGIAVRKIVAKERDRVPLDLVYGLTNRYDYRHVTFTWRPPWSRPGREVRRPC